MMSITKNVGKSGAAGGFSLVEVTVALAIAGVVFAGMLYGYVQVTDRAEWSAYSLAAHSLAMQGVERARAAKWDPQAWPVVDELGETHFLEVAALDVPEAGGQPVLATNYVSITTVSTVPALRQLRADCVWELTSRNRTLRGPFTNTVITLRTADQ